MVDPEGVLPISDRGRTWLLRVARDTIIARLRDLPPPSDEPDDPVLREPRGAFVTLKIDDRLRGCIGHIVGIAPLWLTVRENAEAAAFNDPRFPPLGPDEVQDVRIEISALTPLRPGSAGEVVAGLDGVMIESGPRRAVLLPQVAVEYGWDAPTFLDAVCRKAGLATGCWSDPATRISIFRAEVFREP